MTRKEQIKEELRTMHILDVLNKYKSVDDLSIILNLLFEKHDYSNVGTVLARFPMIVQYDQLKSDILKKCYKYISPNKIHDVIAHICSDKTKLNLLDEYKSSFNNDYQISNIINSLNDDNLKKMKFREYIYLYKAMNFSDYLRRIKDDDIRTMELITYKDRFVGYNLDWVASAYRNDQKRVEIFNEYYDKVQRGNIASFIKTLDSDEKKLECLKLYSDKIDYLNICIIIESLKKDDNIIGLTKKYKEHLPSFELKKILLRIKDEDSLYKLLDEVYKYMTPDSIMDLIIRIKNYNNRVRTFNKYISLFGDSDLRTMLINIEDSKQEEFLDRHIKYYNSSLIVRIWEEIEYGWFPGLDRDKLINNYIDTFTEADIAQIIKNLMDKGNDYGQVIFYLLFKTTNPDTIKRIYNCTGYKLYVSELETNERRTK